MKILYILPGKYFNSNIGGCISHTTGVVDALKDMGHEVIFCSSKKIPYYNSKLEYKFLKVKDLKIRKIKIIYRDYMVCRQLKSIIKEIQPDIVYIRWKVNLFWSSLFKNRKFKLIFECNTPSTMALLKDNPNINVITKKIFSYMDKKICKNADIISAISEEVKKFLVDNIYSGGNKIIINPNGVNAGKFKPNGCNYRKMHKISKNDLVIGYSGNIRPWHGVEILIKAFQLLGEKKYKNIKLLIIGSGDKKYIDKIKKTVKNKQFKDIIFTGPVTFDKMPAYLRTCDILVSPQEPSKNLPFYQSPIKLYEYMSIGRGIIASDIGQIREVIKDSYNGVLFKYGNEESLAEKITLLIENKFLRCKIAKNARYEAIRKYSWRNNVSRSINALKEVKNLND